MVYVLIFVIAFGLGYACATAGHVLNMNSGKMFYRRDDGSWYPYHPTEGSSK